MKVSFRFSFFEINSPNTLMRHLLVIRATVVILFKILSVVIVVPPNSNRRGITKQPFKFLLVYLFTKTTVF